MLASCQQEKEAALEHIPDWSTRTVTIPENDSLISGKSYLPVYSQVYSMSDKRMYNLFILASLRNTSEQYPVYLTKANYYDSSGELARSYLSDPIALNPLETVDIVIQESDTLGGTGANFIFEWSIPAQGNEPFFQAVMNSTLGLQGFSLTTEAIRLPND